MRVVVGYTKTNKAIWKDIGPARAALSTVKGKGTMYSKIVKNSIMRQRIGAGW